MSAMSLIKNIKITGIRYIRVLLASVSLVSIAIPLTANAITPISQGYMANGDLSLGSVVSLQKNSSDQVAAATTGDAENLLGVVIGAGGSLLSVTNGQAGQVQVATSGIAQALVSDINGAITQGDPITASPVSGVGMKATGNVKVIGIAQRTLSNGSKQSYKDKEGREHSIVLGEVPILVNVAYYYKESEKTIIPFALQSVANALAGKTVNTLPILISAGIFLITIIVVASIVYSMIRSSIISVGRNPMSQSAVYRDLIQLSALVLGLLGVAIVSIYMVLTRL